ncbi:MAG TPA: carboxypeptidase-like regulatory domain-containing protein, partial [Candidatus Hydrogenedentes bacterium]|nr:carboxypeptidase-like regulatory domain-containing protein [Candidatus Hydrogenedentota bacterium]
MSKTLRFALILLVLIVIFTVFGIHRHRSSQRGPEVPTLPSSSSSTQTTSTDLPPDKGTIQESPVPSSIPRHDSLRVSGLVTDGASGRPIAGAAITAQRETPSGSPPDPRASTLSDADGAYEIRIGPEAVTITCAAAGYATAIEVLPTSPDPSLKIDFKLGPGCGAAGIVRGQDTGKGIPDIEVEILSAPGGSQAPNALQGGSLRAHRSLTDSSGGYSVDG